MPQAAEQEDHNGIADVENTTAAATSQSEIDIIPEPCGERDVPATPEIRDAGCQIGIVEVTREANAEEPCCSDGDIAVAGEVGIYLERENEGSVEQTQCSQLGIVVEDKAGDDGAVVGYNHLLTESPQDEAHSLDSLRIGEGAGLLHLRQQIGGTFYGPCYQLGEETDVRGKREQVALGPYLSSVDIYRIAESLEGIEADAHRQDNVHEGPAHFPSEGSKQACEAVDKEIEIFEGAQYQQVGDDVEGIDKQGCTPVPRSQLLLYDDGREVAAKRCIDDEEEKAPVPPSIEEVAGKYQKGILPTKPVVQHPVDAEHNRQE